MFSGGKCAGIITCLFLLTTVFAMPSFGYEIKYDANGNIIEDGRFEYAYDSANRLSEVREGGQPVAWPILDNRDDLLLPPKDQPQRDVDLSPLRA